MRNTHTHMRPRTHACTHTHTHTHSLSLTHTRTQHTQVGVFQLANLVLREITAFIKPGAVDVLLANWIVCTLLANWIACTLLANWIACPLPPSWPSGQLSWHAPRCRAAISPGDTCSTRPPPGPSPPLTSASSTTPPFLPPCARSCPSPRPCCTASQSWWRS